MKKLILIASAALALMFGGWQWNESARAAWDGGTSGCSYYNTGATMRVSNTLFYWYSNGCGGGYWSVFP